MSQIDNEEDIRTKEKIHTRLMLAVPALFLLFILFMSGLVLFVANAKFIANAFPFIIVMVGIVVMFFGAFYDFGANRYVNSMFASKARLREEDVIQINKEQLIMTLIFAGLGGLFILFGVILFYIFIFF
jgi:glucan phosphoethanolaminetransferase (alkaline phosphatase superfamily)